MEHRAKSVVDALLSEGAVTGTFKSTPRALIVRVQTAASTNAGVRVGDLVKAAAGADAQFKAMGIDAGEPAVESSDLVYWISLGQDAAKEHTRAALIKAGFRETPSRA